MWIHSGWGMPIGSNIRSCRYSAIVTPLWTCTIYDSRFELTESYSNPSPGENAIGRASIASRSSVSS